MLNVDPRRLIGGLFPILGWSRSYDLSVGVGDLIAGITVALTLIPQSIAYASLAGFEPQVKISQCDKQESTVIQRGHASSILSILPSGVNRID